MVWPSKLWIRGSASADCAGTTQPQQLAAGVVSEFFAKILVPDTWMTTSAGKSENIVAYIVYIVACNLFDAVDLLTKLGPGELEESAHTLNDFTQCFPLCLLVCIAADMLHVRVDVGWYAANCI